ncbi:MAG: lipid-A-disaccharide synthase N-terminal domain-containing protein [Sedimentisphaerales bacterium]|nr:lipid-A-disaccharide synthase N-terminal domain-containing protein [Sedimentisphaerales bacterium]
MSQNLFADVTYWEIFGYLFQAVFAARFVVQWIASERRRESIIPIAFWYLSIIGSVGLFIYAVFGVGSRPFALGQSMGIFIYTRNLVLIYRRRAADKGAAPPAM